MTSAREQPPLKLLSLDGGGIRGLSELLVVKEVMHRLMVEENAKRKDGEAPLRELPKPCDYFDLIGGTSTGGIIALMLGRLRMDVDTAIGYYNNLAEEVFSDRKRFGNEKFKATKLEVAIKSAVKDVTKDSESLLLEDDEAGICRTFVCAKNAHNMNIPVLFRTYRSRELDSNCKIWEAARATSAAPIFFKRIEIGRKQPFIDGGLGRNNPSQVVLDEAKALFGDRKIGCLMSIGTGQVEVIGIMKPTLLQQFIPAGVIDALKAIATDCEVTHKVMLGLFANLPNTYFRLNVEHGMERIELSECEKLNHVEAHTLQYMKRKEVDEKLALLVNAIRVPRAQLTLEQLVEFQESILPAIHQINPVYIHKAGAHEHVKVPEKGFNADTVSDIVDSNLLEHAGGKFKNLNMLSMLDLMSLIKSGVGYLEQIHVFIFTEIDATSPLLSELGRVFSPFSSILFTESSTFHLPIFKDDGNLWEFDELVYFTASKIADGGSSAKYPLTVISLHQTPSLADGPTGFSQGGSGNGEGEKDVKRRSDKGKERDRGSKDEINEGSNNNEDPDDDPKLSADKTNAGVPEISFKIISEIYLNQDEQNAFQTLTMQGGLTIKMLLAQSPRQFSTCDVKFTELTFGTEPPTNMAYKQFHIRVVVDSKQENARIKDIKPPRSQSSDGEEKQLESNRTGWSRGITAGLTPGPHTLGAITVTALKTNEKTASSEKKQYNSRITEQHSKGIVWWGFDVDDKYDQERGIDIRDVLPTAIFEFMGSSSVPAPPPKSIDILIASYWSMILPSEPKSTWIRKLFFRSTGNTQTTSYLNLFQIVALKTDLSNMQELSRYRAEVKVRSGASDPPAVKREAEDSVIVIPAIVDDWRKLRTFNLPTMANFELSHPNLGKLV